MISLLFLGLAATAQPLAAQVAPAAPGYAAPRGVQARAQIPAQVQALFARLDGNRDGFVARQEAAAQRGHGKRQRLNRQGQRRVADPARQQQRRMMAFDRLDSDRNGVISRAEFANASLMRQQRQAARGDRRIRGTRGGGMARLGGRMFDMADVNRDSRVSIQEATAAAFRRFDTADLNRDGLLTRDERQRGREQRRGQRQRV